MGAPHTWQQHRHASTIPCLRLPPPFLAPSSTPGARYRAWRRCVKAPPCAAAQAAGRPTGRPAGSPTGRPAGRPEGRPVRRQGPPPGFSTEQDPLVESIKQELHPVEERMIQWFPGHIAKAERDLREQLSAVDIVLEVRDGRIPMSTRHPHVPKWAGSKPRLLLLNRQDMIPERDRKAWADFFAEHGRRAMWTDGNTGYGVAKVIKAAVGVSEAMNEKRVRRGLRPRPVRAVVIGFPNVGKSALINRLLGRRVADSAPKPGVTRVLKWMRIGGELDLLDAPGIIPMSFRDQVAAQRLAMCNDIGEASYVDSLVAAALLRTLLRLPQAEQIAARIEARYKVPLAGLSSEEYVHAVGDRLFNAEAERAGQRILKDFRTMALGKVCLELPDQYRHFELV